MRKWRNRRLAALAFWPRHTEVQLEDRWRRPMDGSGGSQLHRRPQEYTQQRTAHTHHVYAKQGTFQLQRQWQQRGNDEQWRENSGPPERIIVDHTPLVAVG
jgi:hypothetical protein